MGIPGEENEKKTEEIFEENDWTFSKINDNH